MTIIPVFRAGGQLLKVRFIMLLSLATIDPSSISVNAPWKSVRLGGWRWSVIIDTQGEILHQELFEKLF